MISTKPTSTPRPKFSSSSFPPLCLSSPPLQSSPSSKPLQPTSGFSFLPQELQFIQPGYKANWVGLKFELKEGTSVFALLAQIKCTSLVCSCYAPTKHHASSSPSSNNDKNNESKSNRHTRPHSANDQASLPKVKISNISASSDNGSCGGDECNGRSDPSSAQSAATGLLPLKSYLKKSTSSQEDKQANGRRKVSWPDAFGKDLAQVREFQPSVLEDGELEGVRNSCVCVIQ